MRRFKTTLVLFLAGLPFLSGKSESAVAAESLQPVSNDPEPVSLRPLNLPGDNLFAAHRSHSSHGSHRSSAGGGSAAPRQPAPPRDASDTPPDGSSSRLDGGTTSRPTDPGRPAPVTRTPARPKPQLTLDEKRKLQIMQVQIALSGLGLYTGAIDGALNANTQEALKRFQAVKGMEQSGLMSTDTLNGLGVSAVK